MKRKTCIVRAMPKEQFIKLLLTTALIVVIITLLCVIGFNFNFLFGANRQSEVPLTDSPEIIEEPAAAFQVTSEEREMLARLVFLESSICSLECQEAVVSVVFNRLQAGKWGDTLEEVIYYPNAFTPANKISTTTPNQESYEAVDNVLQNGCTLPPQVRYFRASHDFSWKDYQNYCTIDNVYFGYFSSWKNGTW